MGKAAKKSRRRRHQPNPTGMPSAKDIAAEAAEEAANSAELTAEEQRIKIRKQFPLCARLVAKEPADREQGCHDIAALVCDDLSLASSLARVVTVDLLRIATSPGTHPERVAAVGALRNLSLHGHQVCDDMVRSEMVAPCITLLGQAAEQLMSITEAPGEESQEFTFVCYMAEHLSCTLTNICEASSHAATQLTAAGTVVPALLAILSAPLSPVACQRAAAQALVVLSDDSEAAQAQLTQGCSQAAQDYMSAALAEGPDHHLRMLVATMLFNSKGPREALPTLHPLLCAVLQAGELCSGLEHVLKTTKLDDKGASMSGGLVVSTPNQAVQQWWVELRAQSLVLELLTNSASILITEDEEAEEPTDWDSMEGMSEEALQAKLSAPSAPAPSGIAELAGFLEIVLPKLLAVPGSCTALGSRPEVASMLDGLWSYLAKAAALVGSLAAGISGGAQPFFLCWGRLRSLLAPEAPLSVHAGAVAALAAVLRQAEALGLASELAAAHALEDPVLSAAEAVAGSLDAELPDRAAALSLLATAGQACPDTPVAQRAAAALLGVLGAQSPELGLGAEALNGLFDLFGDDVANKALYAAGGVHPKLAALLPNWKALIKASVGREQPEALEAAHEAALNLKRFLKYKETH